MVQIYWSFFLLQLLPEAFLTILFGYAFQRRKVDIKFPIASVFLALLAYVINFMLPIRKETGSILIFIVGALILIGYNKIDVLKAVFSCLSLLAIFIIAELLDIWVLIYVIKIDQSLLNEIFTIYTLKRWLYGLPNLIVKLLIVISFYIFKIRGFKKNHVVK